MGLFDKGNIVTGLAIGIGTTIIGPMVIKVLASVAKPLTKAAIKGGITLYETNKEKLAEMKEMVDDLAAEAHAEVEAELLAASREPEKS